MSENRTSCRRFQRRARDSTSDPRDSVYAAMGETDVTFRHLLRKQLGLEGAPFCVAMQGADEAFVHELADEVRSDRSLARRDRRSTMQLLYVVSAAILGSDTARRIFHVESIIQDPNVQELIGEWEAKGEAKGEARGREEGRSQGRAAEARLLLHRALAARAVS